MRDLAERLTRFRACRPFSTRSYPRHPCCASARDLRATSSASTSTASRTRPSAPGWANSSRGWASPWCWAASRCRPLRRAPQGAAHLVALGRRGALLSPVARHRWPVFIEPIFNKYTELPTRRLREPILSLARANGIPADHVYVVDASKQTKRVSANVAGLFGTTRIALNDNLLNRALAGGDQGGHGARDGALRAQPRLQEHPLLRRRAGGRLRPSSRSTGRPARLGQRWAYTASEARRFLPRLFFSGMPRARRCCTPSSASRSWSQRPARRGPPLERVAQKPASTAADARKLEPGPLEEALFFDRPSGRTRIFTAMRWKAEHPETWAASAKSAR